MRAVVLPISLVFAGALVAGCGSSQSPGASGTPETSPPRTGKPSAANTGVPAGTQLRAADERVVIDDGAVLDGLDFDGPVTVIADDVTIRNSRIRTPGAGKGEFAIELKESNRGLRVIDSEIDCGGVGGAEFGIGNANYTATRVSIHGCVHDAQVGGDAVVVEQSYLWDLVDGAQGGGHIDGIQVTGGRGVRIAGNTIENQNVQTAAVKIASDQRPVRDVIVDGNWLSGGGYTIYVNEADGGPVRDVAVRNNRFLRSPTGGFFPNGGKHGLASITVDIEASGNVWDDTGEPAPVVTAE
jgi:hypothetical protein